MPQAAGTEYFCRKTRHAMKNETIRGERVVYHIYQRAAQGFILFYSARDYLIFFSIVSVAARRYGIKLLGICQMVDHVHLLIMVQDKSLIPLFVQFYTSLYARYFNRNSGLSGELFSRRYGIAEKRGDKKIRTAIAYLYNNPVEKGLGNRAEECRWNYLAYAKSPHPFSEKLVLKNARKALRRSLNELKYWAESGKPLNYPLVESMVADLCDQEIKQLTDKAIILYNRIDYKTVTSYYKSHTEMLFAFASNTGSEYDIQEEFSPGSDMIYYDLVRAASCLAEGKPVKSFLSITDREKRAIASRLMNKTGASRKQVAKFLHFSGGA